MKWGRILLAAVAVPVADLLVIILVVTAYAFKLAFQAQGAPDQLRITQFAEQFGRSSWFVIAALLTIPAATWVAHSAHRAARCHGAVVGVIAGIAISLPGLTLSVQTLGEFALMVAAGWLGGLLAGRVGSRRPSRNNTHVGSA
jgi:hypothetical protein